MIEIDHSSKTPAYRQIYLQIREQITSGAIPTGARLPKIRELAATLGVARNTVEAAYRQLSLEGYATGKRGVGYLVEDLDFSILEDGGSKMDASKPTRADEQTWFHRNPLGENFGCTYDFSYGNRLVGKLPLSTFKMLADQVLAQDENTDAASYIDPYGLPSLREQIARNLHQTRDVRCSFEQVILQPGTQAALHHIVSLFDHDDRRIAMENPGYDAARQAFESRTATIISLPTSQGTDALLDALETSEAKLVFLTPSNQFPLGYILPLSARLKVIEWARKNDAYIIEDDYCCEYRYGSSPVPSLASLDPGHVIYLGTMSKILSPAIRISYMVLPPELQRRWNEMYRFEFCALPWLDQELLARFMASDAWGRYVRTTVNMYRKNHDLLIKSIEHEMDDRVEVVGADAGLHILVGDRAGRGQDELVELARKQDVRVYETSRYWAEQDENPMRNFVLVGFSSIPAERIAPGIRRLTRAWYS